MHTNYEKANAVFNELRDPVLWGGENHATSACAAM
jgi:hypothetical protein